ncbi:BamA/TamA family outer membrane protein [Cytophagaceae bacterium SJW1-29]|uniref:BamA/TamA family outer membrane protein n=2 Tax=Salmonirosea aquatica TaxID=2654236 RepID=A0A7C9BMG5_9BACT|nr:BamA/TamA family outer membrane protein [Cytophagaceae bacterium SJW1-29]
MALSVLPGCVRLSADGPKRYLLGTTTFKGNSTIRDGELEDLIPQKPNRRFLGLPIFPYLALYQAAEVTYSKEDQQRKLTALTQEYQQKTTEYQNSPRQLKKIQRKYGRKIARTKRRVEEGNDFMRIFGEPPVYFSQDDVLKNTEKIRGYLFNNGFFENKVTYETDTSFKRIRITYMIQENRPTLLRDVRYSIADARVDSLVQNEKNKSWLKTKDRYKGSSFEEERIRLETLLRDNGYYGFSRQYISYLVNDTITAPQTDSLYKQVDVLLRVENPGSEGTFTVYPVQSVQFEVLPPGNWPDSLFRKDTTQYQDIRYIFSEKEFSPRILNGKMLIRPGKLYSQQDERETQRQLSLTDQFRFVNYTFDTTAQGLRGYFRAIPLDKYQVSADVGVNVIQLQQAPGPFANLSYKIRNVFNGLENFEVNLRGGIEAVTGFNDGNLYRSQELSVNTSLLFPQLLFPAGSFRYRFGRFNPRTQVGLGYNYVNRPEYARSSVKAAMTYSLQPSPVTFFNLSLLDLNILNTTRLAPEFDSLLSSLQSQGNNLRNSFLRSFVSDINFTFVYNTNSFIGPPKNAQYLRVALESGGTTLGLFPGQRDIINKPFGNLQFYQYLRWNVDYRHYWPVGRRSSFVARVNSGNVYSYGVSSVPPYEKYFFAGGSNSVRAWLPRRLGPGASPPRLTPSNFSVEAPGELLLEGNLEFRGRLFRFFGDVNYALFLDAGNVWTLPTAKNSTPADYAPGDFRWSEFTRQIALGTGFGIRYDLQYFVLRFDFGLKVYDPYRQKFVLRDFSWQKPFSPSQPNFLNFNLGVGYPF